MLTNISKTMNKILKATSYLLLVQLAALLIMSLFRCELYFSVKDQLTPDIVNDMSALSTAFLRGVWFDNVIACYIMALPLVFTIIVSLLNIWRKWMFRAINIWFGILYTLVFMAEASNIPYFNYFQKLLNASIWNWAEYGTQTMGMIFGEVSYYRYIFEFVLATGMFGLLLYFLRKKICQDTDFSANNAKYTDIQCKHRAEILLLSAFLGGACFLGIRGRLGYNPIKVSAAYFCSSPILNNLGVNPMFNLLTSTLDDMRPENKTLHLMDSLVAIRNVQHFYGRKGIDNISPLARQIKPEGQPLKKNVVYIFMESMSAKLMDRFGNNKHLTPYLDSIYNESLSFSNFYSSGTHTNHGLYASLYSFPSIMFRNAMKGTDIPNYSGLPTVLKENGYSTMFFMTHESQYDNMNAFLRTNGYDEIYAQENYPKEEIVNHFGVSDRYLFTYALPVLRQKAETKQPFFATIMTISNHPPYIVPEEFQDPKLELEEQIVRYADDCIRDFMEAAKKEPWYKNTIFLFMGDHGKRYGTADCELPESFNHIQLVVHGDGIAPCEVVDYASQVDVAPTLLGMLQIPYIQNNFGIDLLREQRPMIFYSADKTMAARDDTHLYVYNAETKTEFFYNLTDGKPSICVKNANFDKLKNYVFSILQATEYMVQQKMTLDYPKN